MDPKENLSEIVKQLTEENRLLKAKIESIDQNKSAQYEYKMLIDAQNISKIAYWSYSYEHKTFQCSDNFKKILELNDEDNIANLTTIKKILHHDEYPKIQEFIEQIAQHKQNIEFVFHMRMKDGSSRFIELKAKTEGNKPQHPKSVFGTIYDVTDTHFRIEKFRGNEALFRSLFNNLTDIFIIFDLLRNENDEVVDYVYKDVNPSYEMQFGISKEEIVKKKLSTQPQLFQQFSAILKITAITNQPQQDRFFIQSIDQFVDVLIYCPTPQTIATVWRDVSLTVKAETSLRESEEKYRQIFNIGNDGIIMIDFFSSKILDSNTSVCEMLNCTKQDLINTRFNDLLADNTAFNEQIIEKKPKSITGNLYKFDKQILPFEASLSYFNWSGYRVILLSIRDITERLSTQKELIYSEKRYKQLFEYSNDAILILRNFKIIDYNHKSVQLFKNLSGIANKTLWNLSPAHQENGKDSREAIADLIQQVLQGTQVETEWLFQRDDKSVFIADLKFSPIIVDDDKLVQVIIRDINQRKEQEEALLFNELRWKDALEIGSMGVWEWNLSTNEVYFSRIWKKILGYEKDELLNKFEEFNKRIHPDDVVALFENINLYTSGKLNEFNVEFRMRCKNGSYKWINSRGKINTFNNEGKAEKFFGIHTDITRYVLDQKKAAATSGLYLEAAKTIKLGLWELNIKTMIMSGSEETFAIFGFNNIDRVTLKQIESIVHPEDQPNFIAQFNTLSAETPHSTTFRVIIDNKTKYIQSYSTVIIDEKNRIEGFRGIIQDISNLKQQEIVFKDEQLLMHTYFDKTQQAILIFQNQEVVYSNDKFVDLTGYQLNEIISNTISMNDLITPEDKPTYNQLFNSVLNIEKASNKADIRIENKFKRIKWIEVLAASMKYKGQNSVMLILTDITLRKNLELELSESDRTFKNVALSTPMAIALIDLNNKFTYANSEFNGLTGISETVLTKTELKHLFNDNEYFNINSAIVSLKNRLIKDYQSEAYLKNQLFVKVKIEPIYHQNSALNKFIIYLYNIDIQKKQIEILSEENSTIKALMEYSSAGLGIFNKNEELYVYNQSLLNIANLDFLNKTTIHFSDLKLHYQNKSIVFNELIAANKTITFEYKSSANNIIFVELKPIMIQNTPNIILTVRDISDNYKRNIALLEQLERFKTIFDRMPSGCALIDKNRNIIFCNQQYAQILDSDIEQLKYKKLDQLTHTDFLSESISKFSELFSGVTPSYSQLCQMITFNNTLRWINAKTTTFTDKFNEIIYAIQIIDDVTDIKEKEYQFLNQERIKTLNHIANSFAHNFNNQLMTIYGNSYLIKTSISDEKMVKYADTLLSSIQKTTELTHNLLSFSKNKSKIDIKTNINKLIEDLLDQIYISPSISIKLNLERKHDCILGDPTLLLKALNNMIENACLAMPDGGELIIETKLVYFEKEKENLKEGKYLRITITDNGKGIQQSHLPKIFDPFFTTRNEVFNAGLGLTIALNIVREHEGDIRVQSQYMMGSSFMIYLPLQNDDILQNSPQPDEQLIVKGSANLMIIDDEDVVRIITGELLKKLGYNVFSFANGKKAINFYKSNFKNIDLVLLDKQMPEIDGLVVYDELKKIKANVKAILLTGFNIDSNIENIFMKDQNLVIQKPVSVEKLSQAISQLIQLKKEKL